MAKSYLDEKYSIIYVTCSELKDSAQIGLTLLYEKLAACVTVIPSTISIYRWKDNIQQDSEVQLVIKTRSSSFSEVSKLIKELHSAELPEIIAVEITQATDEYKKWLYDETNK